MEEWKIIVIVVSVVISLALIIGLSVGLTQKNPSNPSLPPPLPALKCPIQTSQQTSNPSVEAQGYCEADGYNISNVGPGFGLVATQGDQEQPGPYTMQTCIDACNDHDGCTGFQLTANSPYWPCWGFSVNQTNLVQNLITMPESNVGIKMIPA